jgi:hypothetical protein
MSADWRAETKPCRRCGTSFGPHPRVGRTQWAQQCYCSRAYALGPSRPPDARSTCDQCGTSFRVPSRGRNSAAARVHTRRGRPSMRGCGSNSTLALGLPAGEMRRLRWQSVDWERGQVVVDRALTWVGGTAVWGNPKSRAGRRVLPCPNLLARRSWRFVAAKRKIDYALARHGRIRMAAWSRLPPAGCLA